LQVGELIDVEQGPIGKTDRGELGATGLEPVGTEQRFPLTLAFGRLFFGGLHHQPALDES